MEKSVFTDEYKILLRLLRTVRAEGGLTQIQVAENLSETQSWISKCERGEHRLDVIELRRFCAALGIGLTDFVTRLEEALEEK